MRSPRHVMISETGITGLETAIVLIAFVVVAWELLRSADTPVDPVYTIRTGPLGDMRMKPATAPNERAYRACREQFHWKSEGREHRLCACIAKDVRFDKFTEQQMLRIDSDLWRYNAYGELREQIANDNAFDACVSRHANIKRP